MLFTELVEIIDPVPHPAPLNMAIDEVLLRQAVQPSLRIYRWCEPALSFGYFGRFSEAQEAAAGRALVRRWTGGGIVAHGADVTYTLAVPRGHPFCRHGAAESYRLIHAAIARFMVGEGMPSVVVPVASAQTSSACFASPVQYDLICDGAKIAGAAQRRTRWGLLHQGSIQTKRPLPGLEENLAHTFGGGTSRELLKTEWKESAQTLAAMKYGTTEWLRKL